MDTEIDLTTASRDVLIAIIAQLQATVLEQQRVIERLQRRIAELEGQAKSGGPPRMPGLKPSSGRQPPAQQQPRKQRRHGFARPRMTPIHRVEHVMENCPDCGAHRSGGWTQRTREVIELPVVPVQVAEHVYIARTCPACRRRCTPPAVLDGVVLGQQRLGVNLLSLIATLREEGRLPIRSVQWYLDTVHQLRLSVGAIVSAIHQTAQRAQPAVAAILDRIRASPVVHADETGWREDGHRRQWLRVDFQHPHRTLLPANATSCGGVGARRWWTRRWASRSPECWSAISTLPTTITTAPSSAAGPTCCGISTTWWRSLPQGHRAGPVGRGSPSALCRGQVYVEARSFTHPQAQRRRTAQLAWERQLLVICQPFLADPLALQGRLCRRIERHIQSLPRTGYGELFVFVAEPDVPSDNNPAERSLRHVVISRKISGGTRSERGTESKMTLASIFGTWRARGLNPLAACRQLLTSPQI